MMVDISEDDSFVRNQDKFEKLQPVIAIGQHATRDDSDESLERSGRSKLPSRSAEMVVHTVIPPMELTDTAVHVAIDARMSPHIIIRRAWEERVIRQRMRSLLREEIARSEERGLASRWSVLYEVDPRVPVDAANGTSQMNK